MSWTTSPTAGRITPSNASATRRSCVRPWSAAMGWGSPSSSASHKPVPRFQHVRFSWLPAENGRVRLWGARGRTDVLKIVDWYMEGKLNIDDLITHKLSLEQINEGFDLMKRGESIRSGYVLTPSCWSSFPHGCHGGSPTMRRRRCVGSHGHRIQRIRPEAFEIEDHINFREHLGRVNAPPDRRLASPLPRTSPDSSTQALIESRAYQ